jgi:hypothetical protein
MINNDLDTIVGLASSSDERNNQDEYAVTTRDKLPSSDDTSTDGSIVQSSRYITHVAKLEM